MILTFAEFTVMYGPTMARITMKSPSTRAFAVIATTAAVLALCAGCAPQVYTDKFLGTAPDWHAPQGIADESDIEFLESAQLGWAGDNASFYLVTWGSGSCPTEPSKVTVRTGNVLDVALQSGSGTCTTDIAATTFVVPIPAGIETGSPVAFWANGDFIHLLPPRE